MRKNNFIARTLMLVCIPLAFISCKNAAADDSSSAWEKVPEILAKIVPPTFPDYEINVIEYGAKPGIENDSHDAIQKAIDDCAEKGGGKVVVPEGEYLSNGPLHLKSNVNLYLAEGATLYFGVNPEDYLPLVEVRWEGTRCMNYSSLIYANGQENIAITGKGTIDGQQEKFWQLWKLIHDNDKSLLRDMGKNLVPVEERVFGKGHFLRPSLIEPYKCKNILIEGITVKNSPFWTIHPTFCTNVTVRNLNIQHGQSNDDGCDPESSSYVLIEGCTFYNDDDNIAIKAGRDNDAWVENGGQPTENIIIRNNTFLKSNAGAVSIGSEMSGGVRNIFVENNVMKNVSRVFYIKSNTDRGGAVENLYYRNNTVDTCDALLMVRLDYKGADAGENPSDFKNFYIENTTVNYAKTGVNSLGLPGKSIKNITLSNVKINEVNKPVEAYFTDNLQLDNFTYNAITAIDKEYYAKSGGEENPDRIYWEDLPETVQQAFLGVFNEQVDERSEVPDEYRSEVKEAFAIDPMLNGISVTTVNKEKVYRLYKSFGWDRIEISIKENGQIVGRNY